MISLSLTYTKLLRSSQFVVYVRRYHHEEFASELAHTAIEQADKVAGLATGPVLKTRVDR
ncbi:hypothetical protein RchiOBHm_Chr1g0378161 [Rosa chinensis]|uniref:Uncharacterized protein n=1 Tax=Rosa chinensis TaxID=74649 RepID=A0A2P6SNC1_ROSCH|nr:hypothetical protein RchiOBHm_Chr1g0378161 [Rosa chinensis]